MLEFVVDPRNGVHKHIHKNEDEHFIILEGSLHLAVGDKVLDVRAGGSVTVTRAYRTPGVICRTLRSECWQFFRLGTSRGCLRQSLPGRATMSFQR